MDKLRYLVVVNNATEVETDDHDEALRMAHLRSRELGWNCDINIYDRETKKVIVDWYREDYKLPRLSYGPTAKACIDKFIKSQRQYKEKPVMSYGKHRLRNGIRIEGQGREDLVLDPDGRELGKLLWGNSNKTCYPDAKLSEWMIDIAIGLTDKELDEKKAKRRSWASWIKMLRLAAMPGTEVEKYAREVEVDGEVVGRLLPGEKWSAEIEAGWGYGTSIRAVKFHADGDLQEFLSRYGESAAHRNLDEWAGVMAKQGHASCRFEKSKVE